MTPLASIREAPIELAHRSTNGLDISLLWRPAQDAPCICVLDDRAGTALWFDIAPEAALDAFRHPFAYAPQAADRRRP